MNPRLAVTAGDPAGVGPEIVRRLLEEPEFADQLVPIGPSAFLEELPVEGVASDGGEAVRVVPGQPDAAGARCAWEALRLAAAGCREGRFAGVVTGPVSKAQLQAVGYPFPGQTEFFADAWCGRPSMAFAGERLRVVLATWHEPLAGVAERLRQEPELLERAVWAALDWARREGHARPRIAVCGWNPHAGEEGLLGTEEVRFFNPQLARLRKESGAEISDCLPADTVFQRQLAGDFAAVVALYHDQGLIPVKTLEFHHAVNVTLGLEHVRTSPDHGTAFAIAGKGVARPDSFRQAVRLARRLAGAAAGGA